MQESPSPNKALVAVIIIVILAGITAGAVYVMNNKADETSDMSSSTTNSSEGGADSSSNTEEAVVTSYKDGTYSASGRYSSPGGQEEVDVTVTLANNVITDVTVTTDAASGTSAQYQSEFKNGYKKLVVGKNISDVKLSRVAGSSLTSTGFNNALDKIKTDAV